MKFRSILMAAVLLVSQGALGQLETLVNAVETAPSNISFPASENGTVSFKPCSEECNSEYTRVALNNATQYFIDGRAVKFADFRIKFAQIKHSNGSYALVSYDTKSKIVTSINISG